MFSECWTCQGKRMQKDNWKNEEKRKRENGWMIKWKEGKKKDKKKERTDEWIIK